MAFCKFFQLCCNKEFASKIIKAKNALQMTSNGGGLKIPGYKYLVWYSKKAITNIICLKNLIKCYRVTYDSEADTTFVVHHSAFGLPDMLFEMHPCGLHACYPKNMGEFGFFQMVEDNMKLFSKRQIAGAVQAQDFEPCADEDDDSFVAHPNDKLTGVDVHSGDAELPGVDTDFDAKPTGVEVDTEAYGDVPQEQNEVYVLGQQDPIAAPNEMPSAEPSAEPLLPLKDPAA